MTVVPAVSTTPSLAGLPPRVDLAYLLPICLVATIGGLLFGYDTGVISGAIEPMTAKFGLSDTMKGWAAGCVLIGCALGVLLVGPFSDRFGRKKSLFISALLFLASSIGTALPSDITWFIVFRILGGMGIGFASMTTPMYIAEITPTHLRGRLVAVNQIAIVTGLAAVYFANYFIAGSGDQAWNNEYGWRWMFASGIAPSVVFLLLLIRIPESPRWLMEQRREAEALAILRRVAGDGFATSEVANIRSAISAESGTWAEVFSPRLRRPLLIGIALAVLQQITGINVFMYFGTTIFKNMSASTGVDAGMLQQFILGGAMIAFTAIAIALVDRWGRKPLMLWGTLGMMLSLVAMGVIAQVVVAPAVTGGLAEGNQVAQAAADQATGGSLMLICILLYIGCFSLSVGPVVWVILSEIYPTAIRGRALGLAVFCLWLADYAVTQTFPMMDKNPWLVEHFNHAFPFYVYAGFCLVLLAVMQTVPETKGRSLEDIEKSW